MTDLDVVGWFLEDQKGTGLKKHFFGGAVFEIFLP
jgi:hypothetical protein